MKASYTVSFPSSAELPGSSSNSMDVDRKLVQEHTTHVSQSVGQGAHSEKKDALLEPPFYFLAQAIRP